MKMIAEIFNDMVPVPSRLLDYGFSASHDPDRDAALFTTAVYSTLIMSGAFRLDVSVSVPEASVDAVLMDTGTGDEYTQIDNSAYIGAYVGEVRKTVKDILTDIADSCFYRSGSAWIIPANPTHYDIFRGFAESPDNSLLWTQRLKVSPGDLVFVYHTEPIASLACRCEVVRADIPTDTGDGFTEGKHLMLLRLIERYPAGRYPRAFLNAHGINKTVRGQRSAPPELVIAVLGL